MINGTVKNSKSIFSGEWTFNNTTFIGGSVSFSGIGYAFHTTIFQCTDIRFQRETKFRGMSVVLFNECSLIGSIDWQWNDGAALFDFQRCEFLAFQMPLSNVKYLADSGQATSNERIRISKSSGIICVSDPEAEIDKMRRAQLKKRYPDVVFVTLEYITTIFRYYKRRSELNEEEVALLLAGIDDLTDLRSKIEDMKPRLNLNGILKEISRTYNIGLKMDN